MLRFAMFLLAAVFLAVPMAGIAQTNPTQRTAFIKGLDAFDIGAYEQAYKEWLALAREGVPQAMINVGQMHRLGLGIKSDPEQAKAWYSRAAEAGNPMAQTILANMLLQAKNYKAALPWYEKAADAGDITALYNLGQIKSGLTGHADLASEKDISTAIALLKKAQDGGHKSAKAALNTLSTTP